MQFYYGSQMPLRLLDECEFWKQQEEEHTVVIREAMPNLEQKYVERLKEWEAALRRTHQYVVRFIESVIRSAGMYSPALYQQVLQLVAHCLEQSQQFIRFLNRMMQESRVIQSSLIAMTIMKHIIRESEYFIGIAQTILYQRV